MTIHKQVQATSGWLRLLRSAAGLCLALALALPQQLLAVATLEEQLAELTRERELLTSEAAQYEKTLAILSPDGTPAEQSSNPAVRKLAEERQRIKLRLVAITEQELRLLQEQIALARDAQPEPQPASEARG